MINLTCSSPGLGSVVILSLSLSFTGNVFAHSYQTCLALRAQICQDYYPPSMRLECLIGNIGSCATHTHGNGGFVPVELPFGSRTFPTLNEILDDEKISSEYKALAREALDTFRLYEEAKAKEFNLILRAKTLTNTSPETDEQPKDTKK